MKISPAGVNLIKAHEGFVPKAYLCPAGVWTIGYGHTNLDGSPPKVTPGSTITKQQAEAVLADTVTRIYGSAVERLVKVPLNQNQFDALVSLCFNIGESNLGKSTLLRKLNARDYVGARQEFAKWNKGGGRVLAGLTRRRADEAKLFGTSINRPAQKPIPTPSTEPMPQQVDPPAEDRPSFLERAWTWLSGLSGFSALAYLTDWRVVLALGAVTFAGGALTIWFLGPEAVRQWIRRMVNR